MKNAVKGLLHRFGYQIIRLDSRIEIDSAWGPNILIYALEDLARKSRDPLTIVQIGANDGSDQDPLVSFLHTHDCKAILIEPMDHPFSILQELYSEHPTIHAVQAAVSDRPGIMDIHYIVDASENPDLTLFSSLDRSTVQRNLRAVQAERSGYDDHRIATKTLQTRTLGSILSEHAMENVDAVIVDVEGFDHKIVQGFLNDGVEPRIIRFEYCNLSRQDFNATRDLLLAKGYEIVRSGIDIYCQKVGLLR